MVRLRMNGIARCFKGSWGLAALGVLVTATRVWAVAPNLTVVSPLGGQRGQEVRLRSEEHTSELQSH